MNAFKTLLIALPMVCVPYAACAQDIGLSKQHTACMDKTGGTTAGMIECITAETKRQDLRLNKAYKAVMADLSPERKKQLQESQRAWIKFRDANCGFYDDPDGGSLARVSANDCMVTSTAARARELETFRQ